MRYLTCHYQGTERVGVVSGDAAALFDPAVGDMVALIRLLESNPSAKPVAVETVPLKSVKVLAPIRRFSRDILCTGWNYWDHFEESRGKREGQDVERPKAPTFFTKAPGTVTGPCDAIGIDPYISAKWDYEVEIGLVIGKGGRNIPQDLALSHVFGYFLVNDVSQRDLQRRHGGQWLKGKSIDATMPMGPFIVTPDELDLPNLRLQLLLNDTIMQDALVRQMAFPIAELIAEISFGMTLNAGDVIITGTPAGIGNARVPPVFLKAGDEMICRCEGLGELRNTLVAADLHGATTVPDMSAAP